MKGKKGRKQKKKKIPNQKGMLQATEQQLQLVTRKVQRLEQSVHQEMDVLRNIRVQRNEAIAHLQQLREQLAVAEERARCSDQRA